LSQELSSPLPGAPPPPPPSLLPLVWPPKGLCRSENTPPLNRVVLRSFEIPSEANFRNLNWIEDFGGRLDHRTCVSTRRCCHLWHRSRCTKLFNDLEVGWLASSSTLLRERNPAFGQVCYQSFDHYSITNR
jgi:hypothetical protein